MKHQLHDDLCEGSDELNVTTFHPDGKVGGGEGVNNTYFLAYKWSILIEFSFFHIEKMVLEDIYGL